MEVTPTPDPVERTITSTGSASMFSEKISRKRKQPLGFAPPKRKPKKKG